jgi:hypothetical protein
LLYPWWGGLLIGLALLVAGPFVLGRPVERVAARVQAAAARLAIAMSRARAAGLAQR